MTWRRIDLITFVLAIMLFSAAPQIDLAMARWFYDPQQGFFLGSYLWVQLLYRGTSYFTYALALSLLAVKLAGVLDLSPWCRRNGRAAAFVFWTFLVGPGLMVNTILKSNWGRARPAQVAEFGGQARFTPALQPAGECRGNCSFVSGHASIGFGLFAFAFVAPHRRRRWILAALAAGALIGLARMGQGGHFLSDVVFSGFVTWFSTLLVARCGLYLSGLRRRARPTVTPPLRVLVRPVEWLLLGPSVHPAVKVQR